MHITAKINEDSTEVNWVASPVFGVREHETNRKWF